MDNLESIPTYNRIADIKRLAFIKENLAASFSTKGTVLDVGCGNGIISLNLGKEGYTVQGIDMSDKSIENAQKKNPFFNVSFSVMDAETLRASGQRYDAIVCSEVLEHLNQPANLVRELHSILQDNGILFVTVPNGSGPRETFVTKPFQSLRKKNNWLWRFVVGLKKSLGYSGTTIQSAADDLDHIQFFTHRQLTKLAEENGFQIKKFASSNFIDDIFPVSLLASRSKFLQKIDGYVADMLPTSFGGSYLMLWKKK
jgi:2-polyprenyl-3-methyl-5-hydroxy-6-metoxy-1,4-benzoquinol methylase